MIVTRRKVLPLISTLFFSPLAYAQQCAKSRPTTSVNQSKVPAQPVKIFTFDKVSFRLQIARYGVLRANLDAIKENLRETCGNPNGLDTLTYVRVKVDEFNKTVSSLTTKSISPINNLDGPLVMLVGENIDPELMRKGMELAKFGFPFENESHPVQKNIDVESISLIRYAVYPKVNEEKEGICISYTAPNPDFTHEVWYREIIPIDISTIVIKDQMAYYIDAEETLKQNARSLMKFTRT